jgi:hypothetical protein
VTVNVAGEPVSELKLLPLIVGVIVTCVPLNVVYSGGETLNVHWLVPVGTVPYVNVTVPLDTVFVTPGHDELPTHDAKSVVLPSPVIAVDGNDTVVPVQPPVALHDTVNV